MSETAIPWPVGTKVVKATGYLFPGEVRGWIMTRAGFVRYVVEATGDEYLGMLHIFSPEQLVVVEKPK